MELSIVVPARNEEALIRSSLARISRTVRALGVEHEIVVGNSGSTDGTAAEARAAGIQSVRVVEDPLPGKGRILTRALAETTGDIVGFIDADLEIDDAYLPELYGQILAGADVAVACKRTDTAASERRPLHRRVVTATLNRCIRTAFGTSISDHQAGLKLFRGPLLRSLLPRIRNTGWLWDTEVLVYLKRAGCTIAEVPVVVTTRRESHLTFGRSWLGAARDLSTMFVRSRFDWTPTPSTTELSARISPGP